MAASSAACFTAGSSALTVLPTGQSTPTHRELSAVSASVAAIATFLELCLDTPHSDSRVGEFWAAVGGGRAASAGPGHPADVIGAPEQQSISVCLAPETKTVKNRVHLDVYARSTDDLVALGAEVLLPADESGFRWTVMRDPEGNEFCVFPPLG
jgi:Glyoxalase-like domain